MVKDDDITEPKLSTLQMDIHSFNEPSIAELILRTVGTFALVIWFIYMLIK